MLVLYFSWSQLLAGWSEFEIFWVEFEMGFFTLCLCEIYSLVLSIDPTTSVCLLIR